MKLTVLATFGLLTALAVQLPAADTLLRLPVRFHLLHSPSSTAVNTTHTRASVDTMLAVANAIWRQAGIEWIVESVNQEGAPNGPLLDSLIAGTLPLNRDRLVSFEPRDQLLRPGWNVFLIRDFGPIAGGVFLPELHGVVLAERGFGYELPAGGRGGGTLAHEFGHSLALPHEPCDPTRNLMAIACSAAGVVSRLTAPQITAARGQAATGRPASDVPAP